MRKRKRRREKRRINWGVNIFLNYLNITYYWKVSVGKQFPLFS